MLLSVPMTLQTVQSFCINLSSAISLCTGVYRVGEDVWF